MTSRTDRVRGGVVGHLVGDAVGVPYEFRDAGDIGQVVFGARGTHHQKPGTWSDDGALMLAALDSLLESRFDARDQGRRFLAWADGTAYTPNGDGRFDIGGATARALARLRRGTPPEEAGNDPHALGNGSLMRILPMALVDPAASVAQLVERAHRSSRITHGAPACLVACALYVLAAHQLADGAQDRAEVLQMATADLQAEYDRLADGALQEALAQLLAWTDRSGGGLVTDSFWSAWDAFAGAHDYRSAIERAVGYGHDTDTTAAIAGGLAGIYWGVNGIPRDWRNNMRGMEIVTPLLRRLDRRLGSSPPSLPAMDPDYPYSMDDLEEIGTTRSGSVYRPGSAD